MRGLPKSSVDLKQLGLMEQEAEQQGNGQVISNP